MNALRTVRSAPQWVRVLALVVIAALVIAGGWALISRIGKTSITAYFPSTNGLYAGDEVRVLGVAVGRIDSIDPGKDQVRVAMTLDRGIEIPADAKACLLYTSPSPRDRTRSRMPSSA